MSAPRAICIPPPRAWPWTAAITGTGSSCHTQATCWPRWVIRRRWHAGVAVGRHGVGSPPAIAWKDEKSSPAQNDAPSPGQHHGAQAGFGLQPLAGVGNPANIGPSSALRLSGRLSRTSATPCVDGDGHPVAIEWHHRLPHSPAMKLDLTADEVLTTTRSVRKRLDFDRPVDRATVEECIDIAVGTDRLE